MARKRRGTDSGATPKGEDAKKAAKGAKEEATVVLTDDSVQVPADDAVDVDQDAPTLKPSVKASSAPAPALSGADRDKELEKAAAKEAELEGLLHDQVTLAPQRRPTTQAKAPPAPFMAPPTAPAKAPKQGAAKAAPVKPAVKETLGVDVAILWRGDMLTAQFFPKPVRITVGPTGTFTMPEDVVGGRAVALIEPHGGSRFGLRIDNEKATGHLIVDGDVHDLKEVRSGNVSALKGPVVPLTSGTRAVLVFGDFTFIVSRVPVPPPRKFMLWSRDMVPFLLSLLFALAVTVGPLTAAYSFSDLRGRAKLSYKEKLDRRLAVLEFIEIQEEEKPPEEQEAEKKEEEKDEPPPLTPKEKEKIEEKEVLRKESEIEKELKDLDADKKDERIKALVDEAANKTAIIDSALAALDAPGTRLFADSDGDEGDGSVNPTASGGGIEVLADPEGLSTGQALARPAGGAGSDHLGERSATQKAKIDGLGKDNKVKSVDIAIKKKGQSLVRVGGGRGSKSQGELPKKVIKRYIATKMGAIKACYQKGLQSNPNLQGKVTVMFLIQPNGAVAGAKISDSGINSPAVESCILRNVKVWRFPRAAGGGSTKVIYPFNFRNH